MAELVELVELVQLIGQLVFSIHSQIPYRIAWEQKVVEESEEVWRSGGVKEWRSEGVKV